MNIEPLPETDAGRDFFEVAPHDRVIDGEQRAAVTQGFAHAADVAQRLVIVGTPADVLVRLLRDAVETERDVLDVSSDQCRQQLICYDRAVREHLIRRAEPGQRRQDLGQFGVHGRFESRSNDEMRIAERRQLLDHGRVEQRPAHLGHEADMAHPAADVAGRRGLDLDDFGKRRFGHGASFGVADFIGGKSQPGNERDSRESLRAVRTYTWGFESGRSLRFCVKRDKTGSAAC